ncbi:methyltransferase domain-containing protein [Streptomyces sp. BK239]|uniref:class I SAM-dependent methyltransferase n=1 Tax=Streptomyces sp. BK239 TaxID=2512155 RepID=UPI003242E12C
MIELAERAAPTAPVRVAALPELPFADDEFDAVVADFVLNHVGRPLLALGELAPCSEARGQDRADRLGGAACPGAGSARPRHPGRGCGTSGPPAHGARHRGRLPP